MYVPVRRTFREFTASPDHGDDFEYWVRYAAPGREGVTWENLERLNLVAVLGEPRSGKTEEFQQRARLLRSERTLAFFIRLDELQSADLLDCLKVEDQDAFKAWLEGSEKGFIFLDSVDESRLANPAALAPVLRKFVRALGHALKRAHILVSSRISDWQLPAVREALTELNRATRTARRSVSPGADVVPSQKSPDEDMTPPAFQIRPLDSEAVVTIAKGMGVPDPNAFWSAVVNGGYEHFATRPGDLIWLTHLWKGTGSLGGLADLTEAAIAQRLTEQNENYVSADAVIEPARLREAVEALAAASMFSGRSLFQLVEGSAEASLIRSGDVLDEMTSLERHRVLGTAVFDAASMGRVRFHTRTVREYLAACWVAREMKKGLPPARAIAFFVATPFGERVLIKSRRGPLCWLAVHNVQVREYVISHFPEMVMFEGDPSRWPQAEVIQAFQGYLERLHAGFWQDWWNDATQYSRISRALPPSVLLDALERYRAAAPVLSKLFAIIDHGELHECANAVFTLYQDPSLHRQVRQGALWTLAKIAAPPHRNAVKDDLLGGRVDGNELRAAALVTVGLDALSPEELVAVLMAAEPPEAYHSDPLPRAITSTLLPDLDHARVKKMLHAIRDAVPVADLKDLGHQHGEDRKPFAWLLDIYADVLKRALETLPPHTQPSAALIELAAFAEQLNHRQFIDNDDFRELRGLVAAHARLRKAVALTIGLAASEAWIRSPLVRGMSGLVQLEAADLEWVVGEAMHHEHPLETRWVWFLAAMDLVDQAYIGRPRRDAMDALVSGPDAQRRAAHLATIQQQYKEGKRSRVNYRKREAQREEKEKRQLIVWAASLKRLISGIRAGTHVGALVELVNCARKHGADLELVDPAAVQSEAGEELADAFAEGLAVAYRVLEPPDLMAYVDKNEVPWVGLIGMASANYALRNGLDAAGANEADAVRAMRFAVWSLREPEPWVNEAGTRHADAAARDLMPVFDAELSSEGDGHFARVATLVLKTSTEFRGRFLDRAMTLLQEGNVRGDNHQRELCIKLRGHPGAESTIESVARGRLASSVAAAPPSLNGIWLAEWMRVNLVGAWVWLQSLVPAHFPDNAALSESLSTAAGDFERWAKDLPATPENVRTLVDMFRFLDATHPLEGGQDLSQERPYQFLKRIPGVLQSLQAPVAHAALRELAVERIGSDAGHWLHHLASDLASAHAEARAVVDPRNLRHAHELFTRDARTEGELLEQVLARLQEIQTQIETGRHSDRELFTPGMDEKKLQIYLAGRLEDTPGRHFGARSRVSRETEADLGNKPDIEVVAAAGRVPVEVKPIDKERYSANSLADTLRDQIVAKYLVRGGSRNGVLVVMNLEEKNWQIPGGTRAGSFADLIAYLQREAEAIRKTDPNVDQLVVVGIDCVRPQLLR
jgi:hypothetical protein